MTPLRVLPGAYEKRHPSLASAAVASLTLRVVERSVLFLGNKESREFSEYRSCELRGSLILMLRSSQVTSPLSKVKSTAIKLQINSLFSQGIPLE